MWLARRSGSIRFGFILIAAEPAITKEESGLARTRRATLLSVPCSYSIDVAKGVIFFRSSGRVTDAELVQTLVAMANDKDFDPDFRGFSDCTAVTEQLVTAATLQLLGGSPRSSADSRWAFLVNAGLVEGMMEFYRSCLRFGHLKVFTNRNEAIAWLNEGALPEKMLS